MNTNNMESAGKRLQRWIRVVSKDIGRYNTCPHGCTYCYANSGRK